MYWRWDWVHWRLVREQEEEDVGGDEKDREREANRL